MHRESEHVHSGSSFDGFLEEEGIQNEVSGVASRRVIAWQLEQEATRTRVTRKANVTTSRKTSRA